MNGTKLYRRCKTSPYHDGSIMAVKLQGIMQIQVFSAPLLQEGSISTVPLASALKTNR